tara:strand:+ start:309 stop:467 length:159 start_codon:yes stop_codon:yes gene_type:complete
MSAVAVIFLNALKTFQLWLVSLAVCDEFVFCSSSSKDHSPAPEWTGVEKNIA